MKPIKPLLFFMACSAAGAASSPPDFQRDVLPILSRRCLPCHGEAVRMGNLDLRSPASMLKGGNKGLALVKGSAQQSLLYQRIVDQSMPMGEEKLTEEEISVIGAWINSGASGDTSATREASRNEQPDARHWAFVPPQRPPVPQVNDHERVRSPVDAFILRELGKQGIRPSPPADRRTLLRRVYLDLIGLPPTPEEVEAFLQDKSANAYGRVVEDLLSRRQYGERWARHWLDVVRYAETNGYERDGTKPHAWRYRDYVIDALNNDKPFDRFLTEHLAGDEIEDSNAESQIATTFLRLGTWDDEPADPDVDRYDQLDDVLGVTATAFLGLTIRCARCHDHKFEPYPQEDYYRLLAVFEPLKRPQDGRTELDVLVGTKEELAVYREAMEKADAEVALVQEPLEDRKRAILKRVLEENQGLPAELSWSEQVETVLAALADPKKRSDKQKELVENFRDLLDEAICEEASGEESAQLLEYQLQIAKINAARPKEPPRAYIWHEDAAETSPTRVLERGDVRQPGKEVEPGVPSVLGAGRLEGTPALKKSTGRRLALARWMTRSDNPLVARVIVNRLWQGHFGEGLVGSENDFGLMGQRPTHPQLLDYLATELMQSGWSLKHIHRLIVTSSTFQLSSAWDPRAAKIDPDQRLLWRWKPRRLEAEAVRDSILALSGWLNLEMHGPSVYPTLTPAVLAGQSRPGEGWGESTEQQASRRSVYVFSKRSLAVPELEALDAPDTSSSCEQRRVSTTGPQALIFLNGDFIHQQAGYFADRLLREAGEDPKQRVTQAFERALGRSPRSSELKVALKFLRAHERQIQADLGAAEEKAGDSGRQALEGFLLTLLNTNEFFYLN